MKCGTCKNYQDATQSEDPACCAWYLDNVMCGEKYPDDCPEHEKE